MESLQRVIKFNTNCLYHYNTSDWGMLILLQSLNAYHSVSEFKPWHLFLQRSTRQGNSLYLPKWCMLKYQYVAWPAAFLSESKGRQKLFILKSQIFRFLTGCVLVSFSYSVHIRLLEDCAQICQWAALYRWHWAVSLSLGDQRHPAEIFVQLWHGSRQTWKAFWRISGEKCSPSQTDISHITFQNIF